MGVEHYLICDECKEYIDLHKAYRFASLMHSEFPPVGNEDDKYLEGYWDTRGFWFICKHLEHGAKIRMQWDTSDSWYREEPYLKEVFPHSEDLKLRKLKDSFMGEDC